MKKLFLILIFASTAIFSNNLLAQKTNLPDEAKFANEISRTNASDSICRKTMREPKVTISTSYGKLRYDFSKNNRSLTRMHIRQYGGRVAPGKYVHGLATNDLSTEISFKLLKNTLPDGTVCVYPDEINLLVGVQNPTIYLSKDLQEESCAYQVALRHEQTHQQINAEVLESYLPIIQKRFLEAVQKYSLVSRNSDINLSLAQESLKNRYLSVINPLLEEIKSEIKTEQAKLDSAENYDYEEKICRQKQ